MTQIPLPTTQETDVYTFGFDKGLNRGEAGSIIADTIDDSIETGQITPGDLLLTGVRVGVVQNSTGLTPFQVSTNGTVDRVGPIKIASASDVGLTYTPAPTANKVIYAVSNDLRVNAPTTASIVSLDTNGAQRVLVGVIKTGLTDGSANSIFEVSLTTTTYTGGTIEWTCVVDDGAAYQVQSGITTWAAVNLGGVYTTDVDEIGGSVAVSSGTLTGTWSILTGTNKITLQFTPTSSLVPTTLSVFCTVKNNNGRTITRV